MWATYELRYASWKSQQAGVAQFKRGREAAARALEMEARKRPEAPPTHKGSPKGSSSSRGGGLGGHFSATEDTSLLDTEDYPALASSAAAAGTESAAAAAAAAAAGGTSIGAWPPSPSAFAALLAQCGRNHAWKALVHLASLPWKASHESRGATLGEVQRCLLAAERAEGQLERHVLGRLQQALRGGLGGEGGGSGSGTGSGSGSGSYGEDFLGEEGREGREGGEGKEEAATSTTTTPHLQHMHQQATLALTTTSTYAVPASRAPSGIPHRNAALLSQPTVSLRAKAAAAYTPPPHPPPPRPSSFS